MWQTKILKDLCIIFADGDWIEKKDQSNAGIRLVQTGNIKMGYFAERQDKARYISEDTFNRLNCTEIKRGDILVSRLPEPVGRATIIPELKDKAITAVDCTIIRLNEEILPTYLNYYMQSPNYLSSIQSKVTGATRQRISRKNLGEIPIIFPPLAEQERIVAKLDTAFAEIDSAIEQVEAKQADAKRLKASLLGISLRGDAVMWKTVKLGDVCELIGGGTPSKKNAAYYGGEIPWATVRDMHSDELSKTELKITQLGLENSSSKVIPANNIVIASRVGLGKVCLLNQSTAINQDLRGVIPKKSDTIDVRFLFYWFKSIEQTIISAGRGATVHGVTLPFLKALELSLPPLAEQQHIVAKLDAAFS